jgi:hypothetical protein
MSSRAGSRSSDFTAAKRKNGQDNLAWIAENVSNATDQTTLVMVGGRSQISFRLRTAQSHVRSDLLPSYWSHVLLVDKFGKNLGATKIHQISLEPRGGFGFPAPNNGVQISRLSDYANAEAYPNIALLSVPVKLNEVLDSLETFKKQRAVLDGVDLVVRWLAYVWGVARNPNPLLEGQGIPSSAMLEIVVGTCGFDLTPGLESRSSCPEAIWQAATWWHEYYKDQNKSGISGVYFCPHQIQ